MNNIKIAFTKHFSIFASLFISLLSEMLSSISQGRTMIFIDYSNIFYAQYTMGWKFEIEKFLSAMADEENISKTFFFGAYNEDKSTQKKRVEHMKEIFSDTQKYYMFFKPLTMKGGKNKGNVDTEMGFELSNMKDDYDTAILFSGDGDFAYIIERLIREYGKKFRVISTAKHIGQELFALRDTLANPDLFCLYDLHSNNPTILPLRDAVRGKIYLAPELLRYFEGCSKGDLQESILCVEALIQGTFDPKKYTNGLTRLKNNNGDYIFAIIKKWKREDKQRLLHYLLALQ